MGIKPLAMANLIKPATLWMLSLRIRRSRCVSTVRVLMLRRQPISLLQRPSAMWVRTSRSRRFHFLRQIVHHGDIDGEVRGAIGEGHAFLQRGVSVNHRRRNVLVARAQAL